MYTSNTPQAPVSITLGLLAGLHDTGMMALSGSMALSEVPIPFTHCVDMQHTVLELAWKQAGTIDSKSLLCWHANILPYHRVVDCTTMHCMSDMQHHVLDARLCQQQCEICSGKACYHWLPGRSPVGPYRVTGTYCPNLIVKRHVPV